MRYVLCTNKEYFFRFIVVFILVKMFPRSVSIIGLHGVFWVHAGISILVCILAMFIMPETQGKTLTEISKMFEKKEIQMDEEKVTSNYAKNEFRKS